MEHNTEELKQFLRQLRNHTREVSRARLSDGRPFTDATDVVKKWFGKTENRLKEADTKLAPILEIYVSKLASEAEDIRRRNAELEESLNENVSQEPAVIGTIFSGEPLVTVNNPSEDNPIQLEEVPEQPNVEMIWQVNEFIRSELDLEKLRPFFTESAIKKAINAHIKSCGPNQIDGATYQQVVSKNL